MILPILHKSDDFTPKTARLIIKSRMPYIPGTYLVSRIPHRSRHSRTTPQTESERLLVVRPKTSTRRLFTYTAAISATAVTRVIQSKTSMLSSRSLQCVIDVPGSILMIRTAVFLTKCSWCVCTSIRMVCSVFGHSHIFVIQT